MLHRFPFSFYSMLWNAVEIAGWLKSEEEPWITLWPTDLRQSGVASRNESAASWCRSVLTRGVGAAPSLAQAQRVAAPGGGWFAVGEAWWGPWRGRVAAWPLRDFPQLVGQRGLALGDGPLWPGGLHLRQLAFTQRDREENPSRTTMWRHSWLKGSPHLYLYCQWTG